MSTKKQLVETAERLRAAEDALAQAKAAHRQAFREACVVLFNEYGLMIEPYGCEGASLEINEIRFGSAARLDDLPE